MLFGFHYLINFYEIEFTKLFVFTPWSPPPSLLSLNSSKINMKPAYFKVKVSSLESECGTIFLEQKDCELRNDGKS